MEPIFQTQQELAVLPAIWLAQLPAACQLRVVDDACAQEAWLHIGAAPEQVEGSARNPTPNPTPNPSAEAGPEAGPGSGQGPDDRGRTEPPEWEDDGAADQGERGARPALFSRDEVRWLVVGVALERFDAQDFLRCCQRKRREPEYRLSGKDALAGLPVADLGLEALEQRVAEQATLSASAWLGELGLRLTAICIPHESAQGGDGLAHAA